jgi:hypothetical protein
MMSRLLFRSKLLFVIVVAVATMMFGTTVVADVTIVPTGVAPGGNYRLLFTSSTTRNAMSADIADYNAHVTAAANSNALLAGLGTTWSAIASTSTIDADFNTLTRVGTDADVPI